MLIAGIAGRVALARQQGSLPQPPVDFVRDIQPILQTHCYECHGPKKARNGLRLDVRAAALKGGDSGSSIVPGNSEQSLLVRRILGLDGEDRMPKDEDPLTAAQIALIRAWIDQGAAWPVQPGSEPQAGESEPKHWAYLRPVAAHPPAVKMWHRRAMTSTASSSPGWKRKVSRLRPRPRRDARPPRLARPHRPAADARGARRFLADAAARTRRRYEKVVDRLLASPHYGERWARPWLDLARYADTQRLRERPPRVMWKYRDWVIDALQRGHAVRSVHDRADRRRHAARARPTSQRIATGFHRNTMLNEEGGVDEEEARWETLVDRVNTTATVWLGIDPRLRAVPQPQVRPVHAEGVLPDARLLRERRYTIAGQAGGDRVRGRAAARASPTAEQETRRTALQARSGQAECLAATPTPARAAAQTRWEQSAARGRGRLDAAHGRAVRLDRRFDGAKRLADRSVLVQPVRIPPAIPTRSTRRRRSPASPRSGSRRCPMPAARRRAGPRSLRQLLLTGLDGRRSVTQPPDRASMRRSRRDDGNASYASDGEVDATGAIAAGARLPRQGVFVAEQPFGRRGRAAAVRDRARPRRSARRFGRFRLSVTTSPSPLRAVERARASAAGARSRRARERTEQQSKDLAARSSARCRRSLKPARDRIEALQKSLRRARHRDARWSCRSSPAYERPSTWVRRRGSFMASGRTGLRRRAGIPARAAGRA